MQTQEAKKYYFRFKRPVDLYGDILMADSVIAKSRRKAVQILMDNYEELSEEDIVYVDCKTIVLFDNISPVAKYLKELNRKAK